jgi:hypothetical protein
MILGGRTLPELHVSAFKLYRCFTRQCCEVVCKRKKKASTRQDDIINALPDLHDTNGNTIPKMVEYGSYTTSSTSASRAPHARLSHGLAPMASPPVPRSHPCAVPRLCRCEHTSGQ